jgi:6-phosphogluconolactonase
MGGIEAGARGPQGVVNHDVDLTVFPDKERWTEGCATFIAGLARESIARRGRFTIALSGGGTPKAVFERLAEARHAGNIDWSAVHVFFSDERCVPPDDERSNYRMAREALLDACAVPQSVHRIRGEEAPAVAAALYEEELRREFRTAAWPAFDLVLLGMGDNGHTASLFPGTAALRERDRLAVPQYVEVMSTWRVTFTVPLINAARDVAFLVGGAGKADMLWNVLRGPFQPDVWPAQLVSPAPGRLHWLVDADAAAKVEAE